MVGLGSGWLLGIGAVVAGVGSFLSGYAAYKIAKRRNGGTNRVE